MVLRQRMFVDGDEVFYVRVTRPGQRLQRACPGGLPDAGKRGRSGLHLPEAGRTLVGTALKWSRS